MKAQNNTAVTAEGIALRADFKIKDEGTVVIFTPLTLAAEAFLERCDAERWQFMGVSLVVDHRPAQNLIEIIRSEGLEVA